MKESLRLALQPSVVKRALKYAVIVGIVLITINHSDALLNGEVTRARLFKMAVRYSASSCVSTCAQ